MIAKIDFKLNGQIHISAVIPTYNRDKTIARAIDSVLSQETPVWEIVVVDDGSKDNTREVVESYGKKVRYVYQENAGVAAARNRGVKEAKYEWIAFLDSDDWWFPQHLKRITDAIRATEGRAVLYFSDIIWRKEEGGGSYWNLCRFTIDGWYELRKDASEWAILERQPMILQTSVIRRESYVEIGGIPETLIIMEDTFLFYQLCLLYPVCAVSGCGASMSTDGDKKAHLTAVYDSYSFKFHECKKLLFRELLRNGKMRDENRKSIKMELVGAYLNYGRVLLKRKKFFGAIGNLAGAVGVSPAKSVKMAKRILKTYLGNRKLGEKGKKTMKSADKRG